MDLKKLKLFILLVSFAGLFGFSHKTEASVLNLPVNTITGTVYQDLNENGIMELKNLEVAVPNQQVVLYESLMDAVNNQNALQSTTTGTLGTFNFTKLKRNTYYVRYNFNQHYRSIAFDRNPISEAGESLNGIVQIDATDRTTLLYTANLPVKRVTSLDILPFEDTNWNGLMDADESILNNKTMIIINLRRLVQVLDSDELSNLDITSLLLNSLSGNIDIADAIYLRTTRDGQVINLPDVSSDLYIMLRSPFDLTLSGLAENTSKIAAILDIIQGGDLSGILNNPDLISTGDIDTNSDNTYIKLLASIFPKIADEIDKLNYAEIIGEDNSTTVTKTTTQLRSLGNLIDNVPAMRFAKVDTFGHAYDLTGLKIKKTTQFFFGIQQYATITGSVFNDTNLNGRKDTLESLRAVDLTAYDEAGNVLGSVRTPSLLGEYELSKLPYGQKIYLGIATDNPVSQELVEGKPAALADKKIVGTYFFEQTSGVTTISQNIGIASVTDIAFRVKSTNAAANSAVVTFVNTNTVALPVYYTLNGEQSDSFTIPARGLLARESVKDVTVTKLQAAGENIITVHWANDFYSGEKSDHPF